MKLLINRDFFNAPKPPVVYLCDTSKRIISELQAYNRQLNGKWRQYSELSFDIDRTYVDLITGETKVHPLYDKVEVPRNVLLQNYGYFCLQDIDDTSGDNDAKSVSAFSLEYATSNKYLTNWHINTGEIDSVEVLYNEKLHGLDYNTDRDSFYTLASGDFKPYESYYQKKYTSNTSYNWERVQIENAEVYAEYINKNNDSDAQDHEKLYVKNFPNVQFFNRDRKELSLLHLIFEYIPEWEIGEVDSKLWHKERQFSEDRISVYDFLMNNVAETFGCTFVWDSLRGVVDVYEEVEDDDNIENEIGTRFETDVYISRENLASEINVKYSSDNIKTKLVVTGSDNLDIREVNLGRNEIMDLSFYHTHDWMEDDLFYAYDDYLEAIKEAETGLDKDNNPSEIYPMAYSDAMQKWVAANNHLNDLTNEVPAEGNVVLVGDEFKKLYCTYRPISNAYCKTTINSGTQYVNSGDIFLDEQFKKPIPTPTDSEMYVVQGYHLTYDKTEEMFAVTDEWESNKMALIKHLNSYHIYEDFEAPDFEKEGEEKKFVANKQDNILLKLKNSSSDVATIRIYAERKEATEYDARFVYYIKNKDNVFSENPVTFKDATKFNERREELAKDGAIICVCGYKIQSINVRASHGVPEPAMTYSIDDWIKDSLTAEKMNLKGYSVTYIGTMGAYFVLAKDETKTENLQDYGIRTLEEKHKIYTSIFQTQTEAMYSYEKHQCIVQDDPPEGIYNDGTRWLDTNSNPAQLYSYNKTSNSWVQLVIDEEGKENYENYQRYTDNFMKLQAVQEVLSEKKKEAEYYSGGVEMKDETVDFSLYTKDDEGIYSYGGESIGNRLTTIASKHFPKETITNVDMNQELPLYIFTTSADPKGHRYAVYLNGTTPYVSYADSKGVYQMIMEYIREKTEMSSFFTKDQWIRLSPFIKEDEFNDSNFLLTGYESEEERLSISKELMEAAAKELKSLCKPSLEFSMTMANILALPEFEPLFDQFQLGNFIRVGLRDGYIKRARLLEVNINFDDLSDFNCTFGNLVTTKSEVDRHADLLAQAVSAGKQVAKSKNTWQRGADTANELEIKIEEGLYDSALSVASSSGQNITWDERGILGRKLTEYSDINVEIYEPEQFMLTNNKLVYTSDNWQSSKGVFGKYKIGDESRWGVLADAVVAGYIESPTIVGGSLNIGGTGGQFIVHPDGSVQILGPRGEEKYTDNRFQVRLSYSGSTIFSDYDDVCVITCYVYDTNQPSESRDITSKVIENGGIFTWSRSMSGWTMSDRNIVKDNYGSTVVNSIAITHEDIERNASFTCSVSFDETQFDM